MDRDSSREFSKIANFAKSRKNRDFRDFGVPEAPNGPQGVKIDPQGAPGPKNAPKTFFEGGTQGYPKTPLGAPNSPWCPRYGLPKFQFLCKTHWRPNKEWSFPRATGIIRLWPKWPGTPSGDPAMQNPFYRGAIRILVAEVECFIGSFYRRLTPRLCPVCAGYGWLPSPPLSWRDWPMGLAK